MGVMPYVKAGLDSSLDLIAKRLREGDNVTQEALPARWVDLILYLDEQERKTFGRSHPSSHWLRLSVRSLTKKMSCRN